MKPNTKYTKSGRLSIAYQSFGSGSIDLVYIPGWVSNIDLMWDCPELVDFFEELGKMARVILFDKRGTGLSDRVVELSSLEERMDDIRAVMDAVGSDKAVLFGHSEGGSVSALFAATYPNRTIALITFGIFARRRYSTDYPWAPTDDERQVVYDMIENNWGTGEQYLESLAPSKSADKDFMVWLANYFRSGASPSAALVLTKMNSNVDIIDVLGSINVPTLMLQRTHDIDVKIEEGQFIAERIKGAKFVELEGRDHLFWVGNTNEVLSEIESFIANLKPSKNYEERLFTIVAGRFISLDHTKSAPFDLIGQFVALYKGKIIESDSQEFIAVFEGPSKAVHCSLDLINGLKSLNIELAIGIHIKEAALDESNFITGDTKNFIESILLQTRPGQILITQSVKFLLSGAGLKFDPVPLKTNSEDPFSLYTVKDHFRTSNQNIENPEQLIPQSDSFLENVLQKIESHMRDELFGVKKLCIEIGISERQLQRKLKAVTNKSPNQLISSVRLHRAKELLMKRKDHIAEVAFATGFSNPSYFSRCFKQEFGLSPKAYLEKYS